MSGTENKWKIATNCLLRDKNRRRNMRTGFQVLEKQPLRKRKIIHNILTASALAAQKDVITLLDRAYPRCGSRAHDEVQILARRVCRCVQRCQGHCIQPRILWCFGRTPLSQTVGAGFKRSGSLNCNRVSPSLVLLVFEGL